MESLNYLAGGKRKFSVSPRLAQLEQEFRESGGRWEDILLSELFTISTTKGVDKGKIQVSEHSGKYAFIGRTPVNNGIQGYTDYLGFAPNPKNTFSVIQIGENIAQYREQEWYASQNLFLLTPKQHKILDTRMFIIASINCALKIYTGAYNSYPTLAKLKETTISLPCYANGEIAFDFMEGYIRELEEERVRELAAYLTASGLQDYTLTSKEEKALDDYHNNIVNWKDVKIGDVFVKPKLAGKSNFNKKEDISTTKTEEYNLPLVNAKFGNNGIMYYGRMKDWESVEMSIDIVNDGAISTGSVYPQPQRTGVLYNAYLIKPIVDHRSENHLLFYTRCLEKSIKLKFSYDNKAGWEKVKDESFSLPITPTGEIDYTFMENFISAQKKLAIRKVVEWKDKQIAATKQLVNN